MTKQKHLITEGRVFCTRIARDIDIERCLACPLLEDFDLDSRHPTITCDIPASADRAAALSA